MSCQSDSLILKISRQHFQRLFLHIQNYVKYDIKQAVGILMLVLPINFFVFHSLFEYNKTVLLQKQEKS
jgi:hypothetical protein